MNKQLRKEIAIALLIALLFGALTILALITTKGVR